MCGTILNVFIFSVYSCVALGFTPVYQYFRNHVKFVFLLSNMLNMSFKVMPVAIKRHYEQQITVHSQISFIFIFLYIITISNTFLYYNKMTLLPCHLHKSKICILRLQNSTPVIFVYSFVHIQVTMHPVCFERMHIFWGGAG